MNGNARRCLLTACALCLAAGCGGGDRYGRLYDRLVEQPDELDRGVLAGRRIVIDPGHGGEFDGARGNGGLTEAEVNLGVSLHLWGMLADAGADVRLTRTSDGDFLPGDSLVLRDDLAERIRSANAFDPEVFVSIHHNASLAENRQRNGIEVYYRGADPAASLELGRDLLLHLSRNLGIPSGEIHPGDYFVLRNSTAGAAVLTEASYISNPPVERKLRLAGKQRLEAEALFIGLVKYFSRGVPIVERILPAADTIDAPCEIVFQAVSAAGVPLDPASASIEANGRSAAARVDDGLIRWPLPPSTPNGFLELRARVRSVRGATATSAPVNILLSRPAAHLLPLPAVCTIDGDWHIGIAVLDAGGKAVADGTPVSIMPSAGARIAASARAGRISATVESLDGFFCVHAGTVQDTLFFDPGDRGVPVQVVDARTGEFAPGASATGKPGVSAAAEDGLLSLPAAGGPFRFVAPGYRAETVDLPDSLPGLVVELEPLFDGALLSRAVALDAAGGGRDADGIGKNRLRGADVNIETARRLDLMLEQAGARSLLVRRGEETLAPHDRVGRVNAAGVDLAVSVGRARDGDECIARHYPGSAGGARFARLAAASLSGLPPCRTMATGESAAPFLRRTNCPACIVRSASLSGMGEIIFGHHARPALEAERLFSALLAWFGAATTHRLVITGDDNPVAGVLVCIDGTVSLETNKGGEALFTCVTPGTHLFTCLWPDGTETVHRVASDDSPVDTLRFVRRP